MNYRKLAIMAIKKYLNIVLLTDADIELQYSAVVDLIVFNAEKQLKHNDIKSQTQGARGITYTDQKAFEITEDIKALLPLPKVRLM